MDSFIGLVELGDTISAVVVTRTTAGVPTDSVSAPTFRVYGSGAVILTGSASLKDTGVVTGATNAAPIVITSQGHGLTVGTRVTVASVLGNTAANGTFQITAVTSNTFTLGGSTGNGAYTSGGTWHVSGLYKLDIAATGGNGFDSGNIYSVILAYVVGTDVMAQSLYLQVA